MPKPTGDRNLLARILETPHLAEVVPRLQADVLHRLIERCGLEDCGELVALATPDQLTGVFDLDLWRSDRPGLEEQFDADRFGIWLEVLLESGAAVAAQKVTEIDAGLVTAALAQHVRVFDPASVSPSVTADGEEVRGLEDDAAREIGGYLIVPRRDDSWDAIAAVMLTLDSDHGEYFHRVMQGCRRLSNSAPEVDGLDDLLNDRAQVMFDLAIEREQRRERQGFVTPAQARAFLQMSRQIDLTQHAEPSAHPIATAYFRGIDRLTVESESALAAVVDVLTDSGVLLPESPRALLTGSVDQPSRLTQIRKHMQFVGDRHQNIHSVRSQELAYLANALVAGCSIQGRPFTAQEASEAVVAVCNLGLENVGAGTVLPEDFLVAHDLVRVFQVGWTILHKEVCLYAAECLISVLTSLRCDDRETQTGLDTLRAEMERHWRMGAPWHAHEHLDVMVTLDSPSWAALLGLTSEHPVMHAAIAASRDGRKRTIDASAFEFISDNSQIASVHAFMDSLSERLSGD